MQKEIQIPSEVRLHQQSRVLELVYENESYRLDFEYLRVFTPSAEARGHAPGQEILQTGKRNVILQAVAPVGTYALKLSFSDGHDSGLYTWELLHNLCIHRAELWAEYLKQLERVGASRDVDSTSRPAAHACGQHH